MGQRLIPNQINSLENANMGTYTLNETNGQVPEISLEVNPNPADQYLTVSYEKLLSESVEVAMINPFVSHK